MVYRFRDEKIPGYTRNKVEIEPNDLTGGINVSTSPGGCWLPDDEIPNLISALQNYMSRKAKEIAKGAGNGR